MIGIRSHAPRSYSHGALIGRHVASPSICRASLAPIGAKIFQEIADGRRQGDAGEGFGQARPWNGSGVKVQTNRQVGFIDEKTKKLLVVAAQEGSKAPSVEIEKRGRCSKRGWGNGSAHGCIFARARLARNK